MTTGRINQVYVWLPVHHHTLPNEATLSNKTEQPRYRINKTHGSKHLINKPNCSHVAPCYKPTQVKVKQRLLDWCQHDLTRPPAHECLKGHLTVIKSLPIKYQFPHSTLASVGNLKDNIKQWSRQPKPDGWSSTPAGDAANQHPCGLPFLQNYPMWSDFWS